jgi:Domain of unknown function (DUF4386)
MNSTKKTARRAGLLYLLMSIPAPLSLIYIPSVLTVWGDAAATAGKIKASELLFRFGIAGNLLGQTIFIFVGLALYDLFKGVNRTLSLVMLVLVLVSVPISLLNELNQFAALILLSGANFLSAFDPHQLNALLMVFLKLHGNGFLIAEIFWGLWLFPFGALVYKSGFLPRLLGVLLIPAGFAYLAVTVTHVLFPSYGDIVSRFATVLQLGELPIIFWLLIMGAKDQPLDATE